TALITGSSGLIGSACVRHFAALGWEVHGLDNNGRRDYFGEEGDTTSILAELRQLPYRFIPHCADIANWTQVGALVQNLRPGLVIHAAAQPSHDYATREPLLDFAVNAKGTVHLLEACRRVVPEATFCFLSTNKVYGDVCNRWPFQERETRYEFPDEEFPGFD